MAPHLVHLQSFPLCIGLGHRLSSPLLLRLGDSTAFLQRIGGLARAEPTLDGRRVIVQLAGDPPQGEEEEEGQEGLVELQLFVCSTQAWARRGRRIPRYRADGARKGRGGSAPERSAA